MTRISVTIMLQVISGGLLASMSLLYSASAFSPVPRWHSIRLPVDSTSTVVLFADTKNKNKKQKKKNNQRSSSSGGGGGGGGFGNTGSPKSAAAPTVTQRNTPSSTREQIHQPQQQEGKEYSGGRRAESSIDATTTSIDSSSPSLSSSGEEETARLMALYMEQFQQENGGHHRPQQLVQVSSSPLIFTIDEFIDPIACRKVQNNAAGCFDLFYPETVADRIFNGQESELDGLLFTTVSSLEHDKKTTTTKNYNDNDNIYYPDGLHMDTNNQCQNRHVTCILYLNDIPEDCGGGTVFPLARCLPNDPALGASHRLLKHQISHTRNGRDIIPLGLEADAHLIETRVGTNFPTNTETETAIRIQPKAGRLLVFFSRDSNGEEDPRAWHAGERIRSGSKGGVTEKRILTLFKEVDYDGIKPPSPRQLRADGSTLEAYLAPQINEQRKWLKAKAKLQRALLSVSEVNNKP